jgi:hypothetical protein
MGRRQYARKVKTRSEGQIISCSKASKARRDFHGEELENIPPLSNAGDKNTDLKKSVTFYKEKAKTENKKY